MYADEMFEKIAHGASSLVSILVTWRRATGTSAGIPEAGVQKRPTFRDQLIRCYLYSIDPSDKMQTGGWYQHGDVLLGLEEFAVRSLEGVIHGASSEVSRESDRVVFRSVEYRVIGQVEFNPIGPTQVASVVHLRKLGLPL
jgi:hypothetical protein